MLPPGVVGGGAVDRGDLGAHHAKIHRELAPVMAAVHHDAHPEDAQGGNLTHLLGSNGDLDQSA